MREGDGAEEDRECDCTGVGGAVGPLGVGVTGVWGVVRIVDGGLEGDIGGKYLGTQGQPLCRLE